MSQFQSLIAVTPLGLMYGSAGGFLSPENLVGRSNNKFPPDTAAIAGLIFNANREQKFTDHEKLRKELTVAGPFWAKRDQPTRFYVPIPWHRIIDEKDSNEWVLIDKEPEPRIPSESDEGESEWRLNQKKWHRHDKDVKPAYFWQSIDAWDVSLDELKDREAIAKAPWEPSPFLHPKIKPDERHVVERDGLFLENAIQLSDDYCLVYLTNLEQKLKNDCWYRLGGEGHLVELEHHTLSSKHKINRLLSPERKIGFACALITPGVWGSNKYSYRYPQHRSFPKRDLKMLTDRPIPYRYRIGQSREEENAESGDRYDPMKTGRLSRGRYAVPPGSVYVFRQPLEMTWWDFQDEWFPKEGFPLKHLGCGLCLPIDIQGVPECTTKLTA